MNYVIDVARVGKSIQNTKKQKTKNIFRGRLSVAFFLKTFLFFELLSDILLKLNA